MPVPVAFHTGVSDPVGFACRLLRKAVHHGARVAVTAPASTLAALDAALWTFEAQEFLPHVRLPAPPAQAARSPIWLCADAVPTDAPRLRLNIGAGAPVDAAEVDRVIEIVGDDDVGPGRERWRHYEQDWGVKPEHHRAGP